MCCIYMDEDSKPRSPAQGFGPMVFPPCHSTTALAQPPLPFPACLLLIPFPPSGLHPEQLLMTQRVSCAHIYSALDQTARKINLAKFTHGKCSTLIVTDLAARGLDIPLLDNVINYSFPAKGKLFLHRVGKEPAVPAGVLCPDIGLSSCHYRWEN